MRFAASSIGSASTSACGRPELDARRRLPRLQAGGGGVPRLRSAVGRRPGRALMGGSLRQVYKWSPRTSSCFFEDGRPEGPQFRGAFRRSPAPTLPMGRTGWSHRASSTTVAILSRRTVVGVGDLQDEADHHCARQAAAQFDAAGTGRWCRAKLVGGRDMASAVRRSTSG